jgi:molybdenum cofactor cytidylyltransferase
MKSKDFKVGAIVLAAGASRRMGQSKMLLPWGETTVIGKVIRSLLEAGVVEPVVVTGRTFEEVHEVLAGFPVHWAHNPKYETTEMLQSLQIGVRQVPEGLAAFLVVLGDQPQIEGSIVKAILLEYQLTSLPILIPSFQHRRGHPWLVHKDLWSDLLALDEHATLRQFLNAHADEIEYLNVDSASVLMDLDTPEDYARYKSPGTNGF